MGAAMTTAYCLNGDELQRQIQKLPWLLFPSGLCEVLVICDVDDHARHFRAYVSASPGQRLLEPHTLAIDACLALIKAARCKGVVYDLGSPYETHVAMVFDRFEQLREAPVSVQHEELNEAYQLVRNHVVTAIDLRLVSLDGASADRLRKIRGDLPGHLHAIEPHHEPCFAEFDAWHHVELLRDLSRDLQKHPTG
jgi:hypothetical protein